MTTKQKNPEVEKDARHKAGPPRSSVGSAHTQSQTHAGPFVARRADASGAASGTPLIAGYLLALAAGTIIVPGVSTIFQGSVVSMVFSLLPTAILVVAAIGLFGSQLWGWWAGTTLLYTIAMFSGFGIIGHIAGLQSVNLIILAPVMIVSGLAIKYLSSDAVIKTFIQGMGSAAMPKKVGPAMLGAGLSLFLMLASRFL